MEAIVRLPTNFQCHRDVLVAHADGRIDYHVADELKGRSLYACCTAWGISAMVWWSKVNNCWFSEIRKKERYLTTVSGEVIEDVVINIQKFCGLKR